MFFDELMSLSSERKLRQLVKKWWVIYEGNKITGLNHLTIILLHSAGIKDGTFDLITFPDESLKRNIFSSDHEFSNAPISLQQFSKKLGKFMDILLQRKLWTIIQDISFIFDLVSVVEYFRVSPHDSVRAVSYLSGMKIFRHAHYCSDYLLTACIPHKNDVVRGIEELKTKVHLILRYSLRDNAAHIRTIPLKELLSWSEENFNDIFGEDIRKYILRGIKDSFIGNRKISLNIFYNIFENPSFIYREQQQIMFKKLIPELTTCLRSNNKLDFLILKIVNQGSIFLDLVITPEEDLNFSMCLYDENGSVLDEAKTYFYKNHIQGKTGVNIILETFKFYRECPVKNASKLVLSLMSYYIAHTTWRDWESCLKSCLNNDVNEYLNIFYLYVSFIDRPSLNELDSSTVTKMKVEFSIYFSECWLQFMKTDKIAMNSSAQVFMLKLASSFNVLQLCKETRVQIIEWCLKKFQQSHSSEVLQECLSCIHYLNSIDKNIEIDKMLKSQVLTPFIELLNGENEEIEILNLTHRKVHLLVRICEDSYENLWGLLVTLLEKGRDLHKVELIISVLYQLVMNKIKTYIDFKNNMGIFKEDLLSTEEKSFQDFLLRAQVTSSWAIVVQSASNYLYNASQHINEYDFLTNVMFVPRIYGDLIRFSKNSPISELISELPDVNIESYVVYCSQIMNINCLRKEPPALGNCCILLNDYVALTMEGKICITYLKFFIMNFDKINSHWLIIIKIFNLFNNDNNSIGAHALINGLISFHNEMKEKIVDEGTIEVKLSEVTTFILKNLENVDGRGYKKMALHLYLYLENLVKASPVIFVELMEKVKSHLSEEIRLKLTSEDPSIQL